MVPILAPFTFSLCSSFTKAIIITCSSQWCFSSLALVLKLALIPTPRPFPNKIPFHLWNISDAFLLLYGSCRRHAGSFFPSHQHPQQDISLTSSPKKKIPSQNCQGEMGAPKIGLTNSIYGMFLVFHLYRAFKWGAKSSSWFTFFSLNRF